MPLLHSNNNEYCRVYENNFIHYTLLLMFTKAEPIQGATYTRLLFWQSKSVLYDYYSCRYRTHK